MHYLNLSVTGNQFSVSNYLWDICLVLFNCRQKRTHLFWEVWILFINFLVNVRLIYFREIFINFLVNVRLIYFREICRSFSSVKPKRPTAHIHTLSFNVYFASLFLLLLLYFLFLFIYLFFCLFSTEFLD